jgi:chloride channel protein, CIC family
MVVLGALTGLLTGLAAWLLVLGVDLVHWLAWPTGGAVERLLVPAVGGLLVGLVVSRYVPEAAFGGVVGTMETIALRGGRFRLVVPVAALAAVAIALGTGASGGREGPMVLIGGSIGSLVASLLPVSEERRLSLVAAGAAAGIGAAFNAPIGGMLFAAEVLMGGMRGASMQVIVVASVVSSITARQLVGPELIYQPRRELALGGPEELIVYAVLGVLAVGVAAALRHSDAFVRRRLRPLRRRAGRAVTVGVGGLGVGIVALGVPQVLGSGESIPPVPGTREPIQAMLDGRFGASWEAAGFLILLLAAKVGATAATHGSGSAVGMFAPSLFTGAALGGALGIAVSPVFPGLEAGAAATVGMAAVFAALVRAPLTAVVIVFELVGDYGLVLPLMTAVGLATFLADRVLPDSTYVHQLRERGVVYARAEDIDVLQNVTVAEVMTASHPTVPQHTPREELEEWFTRGGTHGFAVVDEEERLVGVVTVGDLSRPGATAAELCTRGVVMVEPDDPVFLAVRRMGSLDVGRVPVVSREDRRVVGMLRRADVVQAYQEGISRSLGAQQQRATGRLRDLGGVQFVELVLDASSAVVGRRVRDVSWPERTVVTSIRRGGDVLVPGGDTQLCAGDELVVLTADSEELRELVAGDAAAG